MDNPFKSVPRQLPKFVSRSASENPQHGVIYMNQLLVPIRVVDEKPAGQALGKLRNNGKRLLVKTEHMV